MKKIIFSLAIILLSIILSTNISFSQWNKVNEHFELQRAKNTKILSYTTYEEDNNLVVIDESGEITEYKMDTGELTKTCNCIKDSTFEYAQVLEDKETVVLGKKYWGVTKYGKDSFYQYELFLINKNKCEFLTQSKIPLDSTVFHLNLNDNEGVSISIYNLEIVNVTLQNNILTVNLNKEYKRDVDYGKPYYTIYDKGEKNFFNFINSKLTFKEYKASDKLLYNKNYNSINLKYAEIYYYARNYNSLGVQGSTTLYNIVNYLGNNDTLKTIYTSGESSSSSNSMAGGYWSKHEGLFQEVLQVLPSNKNDFVYLRMKDSLVEFNLKSGKFNNTYKNEIFNQNLFTSSKSPFLGGGIGGSILKFYDIETQKLFDTYNFDVDDIKNDILIENQNTLYLIASNTKIIKKDLNRYFTDYPNLGFVVSDTLSYTETDIILTALTPRKDCQFFWYVNGKEYITNNRNQVIQFQDSGIYDIKLKILTNENKILEYEQKQKIKIREQLVADFTYEIDKNNPLLVHFTNTSKGNFIGYNWIVPKNGWSDYRIDENKYEFEHFGDFLVTLYIYDDMKSVKVTKVVNIGKNSYEIKEKSKYLSKFLPMSNWTKDILNQDNTKILVNLRYVKADDNTMFIRQNEFYDFSFLDANLNVTKTQNICTIQSLYDDNLTTYLFLKNGNLIVRKSTCWYDGEPYSGYLYKSISDLSKPEKIENKIFNDVTDPSSRLFFATNNEDRIFTLFQKTDSTFRVTKSNLGFEEISEIELKNTYKIKNKYGNPNHSIFSSNNFVSVVIDAKYHFDTYLYDKNLNQISFNKIIKDTNFVMSGIKLFENKDLYIMGTINYKNVMGMENYKADYGAIYKYNFDNNQLIFKDFYSRMNISQIEVINEKYLAVSGDTRSLQGYMILDNDLNLEKDIRYENLKGEFRKLFINKDTIEIFSGSLNYIKDTIDGYILLSANGYQDKSAIHIYPNPASDKTNIDLSKINPINTEISITAFDVMGNKVANLFSGIYNDKFIEVDTRVLPIGNFMIVVSDGTQIISKQIAIMR